MKKLLITLTLLGTVAFANNLNTDIQVAEKALKAKLESSKKIEKAQAEMREKYKLNLSHENVSAYKIVRARAIQAQQSADRAKEYLTKKSYKFLTREVCENLKPHETFYSSVCKVKYTNQIDEAIIGLDSILKVDARAYCMKSMVRLLKNNSEAISETTKDVILAKAKGFKRTTTCSDAFLIASAKE